MKKMSGEKIGTHLLTFFLFTFSFELYALDLSAASISGLSGSVFIIAEDGPARPAAPGAAVLNNEIVETRAKSGAVLLFDDGSRIQLGPNTRLQVSDPLMEENNSVMLFLGRVFARIAPRFSSEPVFTVQTLSTTAGVRGTEFEAAAGMDGSGLVSVETGEVELESDQGEVKLRKGEEAEVFSDGKIQKAKRKLRTEQDWDNWLGQRRQYFLEHSGQVLGNLSRKIDSSRNQLQDQDRELKELREQLLASAGPGKVNFWKARSELRPQIRAYLKILKKQSRLDNKLAAFDNLVSSAELDLQAEPASYSDEFKRQIASARKGLDQMNVKETLKEDRKNVLGHFVVIAKAAKKFRLEGELWRNLPAKTKAKILKRLQEQKQN